MSSIVSEPTENSTKQADVITRASDNSLGLTKEALAELNEAYGPLDFESRIKRLYQDFNPEKILVTSSFAATSAYFLHIISSIRPEQVIHFINTGFHFKETIDYQNYLIERFNLKVEDIAPDKHHHAYSVDEQL